MHEKRDKSILRIFINEKFRKLSYFFTCILPNYLTHESQKDFWKNSHFENTRAGFLLWCQNSLWQNTSKIMHFQDEKIKILCNIMLYLLIQLRFLHTKHLKRIVWISVLWKVSMLLPKNYHKWSENDHFWNFNFHFFFFQNWKI